MMGPLKDSLRELVMDYQDLNDFSIKEIVNDIPDSLQLARSISINRPLVIRSYAQQQSLLSPQDDRFHRLETLSNWSDSKLIQKMQHQLIDVARTPSGKADSVVDEKHFVEPAYEQMTMSDFLTELRACNDAPSDNVSCATKMPTQVAVRDVVYLQSQDGNLSKQLLPLLDDVGSHVPIATDALGADKPDAVNLWIGDDRSITSLHNDPYENFYLMIEGSKTFTLFPPVEIYCMHEGNYRSSVYQKNPLDNQWSIVANEKKSTVPWVPIDPLNPDYSKFPRFRLARPMHVKLKAGDLLYLPSLWYHHVQAHKTSREGLVIACNWWYDMSYEGAHYASFSYLRRAVSALDKTPPEQEVN